MKHIKIFISLTRLNKPIGLYAFILAMFLGFGLSMIDYLNHKSCFLLLAVNLFFIGSVLMRSAGCIFNDIVDKRF